MPETNATVTATIDPSDLPEIRPFPENAKRIIDACESASVTVHEISQIAQCDPGLSVKIVQVANSSIYGMSGNIRSLQQAMVLLGLKAARRLTLSVAAGEVFSSGKQAIAERKMLWQHSLAVAAFANVLARRIKSVAPDEAFLAGIVHDAGKLVFLDYDAVGYVALHEGQDPSEALERERNRFGIDHQEIGRQCASSWGLPPDISDAIGTHHEGVASSETPLIQVVALANLLAKHWGVGTGKPQPCDLDRIVADCHLSLTVQDLESLAEQAIGEFRELGTAFGN